MVWQDTCVAVWLGAYTCELDKWVRPSWSPSVTWSNTAVEKPTCFADPCVQRDAVDASRPARTLDAMNHLVEAILVQETALEKVRSTAALHAYQPRRACSNRAPLGRFARPHGELLKKKIGLSCKIGWGGWNLRACVPILKHVGTHLDM